MHYLNMALIDKASLLMVPSTYEAGTLYNVLPSGNRAPDSTDQNSGYDQTRADFTFDRGSNAAATRVNSDGLIEKYRENLLLQSNQFDTTWSLTSGSSIVNGQSGYDGTNNAWLLTDSGYAGSYALYEGISNVGVLTASIYAKSASTNVVELDLFGSPSPYVQVNLTTGSITSTSNHIDAQSVSVGNGWWRISVTSNLSSTSYIRVGCDGAGSIYIQNAQLETGLVATEYLESTSVTGKAGVLIDLPRIDYSSGAGALLLEPQRANLVTYSEYIGGVTTADVTIVNNATTSPEGVDNASLVIPSAVNASHRIEQTASITSAGTITIYAKAGGYNFVQIYENITSNYQNFDLSNGTFGNGTKTGSERNIEDVGNGWYRLTYVRIGSFGVSRVAVLSTDQAVRGASFTGDGTSGVYLYGFQVEEGSYATSYIPNHSGTGGVTRAADSMSKDDLGGLIHSPEGTLFLEVSALADDGTNRYFSINDGTTSNYIYFRYVSTSNNMIMRVNVGGVTINTLTYVSPDTTIFSKVALKWKGGDYAFWVNGVERGTDTSATSFGAGVLNEIICDFPTGSGAGFPSKTKQVAVFNEALSDSELATLTTL